MSRVLGIELRRSAALGALLVLLVAGAGLLYAAPGRWASGWMSLAMAQREYTVLLWPLALAAGAWQGRREHRAKVGELFASAPRPHAQRMVPILIALAVAAVGAYVAVAAVAVPWIADTASYLPAEVFVVGAVGALALVAAVWLGLAVGRLVPHLATAPALAVAGIGLLMVVPVAAGSREWLSLVFSPMYGMGQYTDYQTVDNRVSVAQTVWLAALGVAALVLAMAGSRRTRTAALLPAVLGAAVAIAVVPRGEHVANPVDPVAQELVCADDTPRVCVSRVHAKRLGEFTPLARQALGLLAKLPDPPTAVHEDTTTYFPPRSPAAAPGVVLVTVNTGTDGRLARKQLLVLDVLRGSFANRTCEQGVDTAVERAASYWLLGREPLPETEVDPSVTYESPEVHTEAVRLWRGLRELSEQEAAARVSAVRRTAQSCGDIAGLLTRSAR